MKLQITNEIHVKNGLRAPRSVLLKHALTAELTRENQLKTKFDAIWDMLQSKT